MDAIRRISRRLLADRAGATAIEYTLIVMLIAVALIGALTLLGGGSTGMWTKLDQRVASAL